MTDRLLESVLNIDMITDEITHSVKDIYHYKIPHDHQMVKSILKFNYILICSFLDELELLRSFGRDNIVIRDIMWSISPLMRAAKKYTGIRKGRNAYFAHYNRNRKNEFYPWWKSLNGDKLPRTIKEVVFLHSIFASVRSIIKSQFISELEELKKKYQPEVDQYMEYVKQQESISLQNIEDVNKLIEEVDTRLKQKNIIIRTLL